MTLEGLQHEEEGLPSFVYSRSKVRECPYRDRGYKGLEVPVTNVTKKMETPVTYFYSDSPREQHVRVRVCFNKGVLTQWYPVTDTLGPPEGQIQDGPLDMRTVEKSFLEWDFNVLPKGEGLDTYPNVSDTDPWRFARIPDSNVLRTVHRTAPRIGPVESEKFLFYRGLGQFTMPIHAKAHALYAEAKAEVPGEDNKIEVENDGKEPIEHVFAVEVHGNRGAFAYTHANLALGKTVIERPWRKLAVKPIGDMVAALRKELEEKLVSCGLYAKEAEAMTRTWEKSYFHTEGLRLLYIVPDELTNRVLPISIDPKPRELKRVLVARLECITPEQERAVLQALADRVSSDAERAKRGKDTLDRLGRFLEPHVRRALAATHDETIKKSAEEVLALVAAEDR
ncbi:hypothetical protein HY251_08465 [bacterium]|nr:hypothetical protein [bacterium]